MKSHFSRIDVLDIFSLLITWQNYYLAASCHLYQINKCMKYMFLKITDSVMNSHI